MQGAVGVVAASGVAEDESVVEAPVMIMVIMVMMVMMRMCVIEAPVFMAQLIEVVHSTPSTTHLQVTVIPFIMPRCQIGVKQVSDRCPTSVRPCIITLKPSTNIEDIISNIIITRPVIVIHSLPCSVIRENKVFSDG